DPELSTHAGTSFRVRSLGPGFLGPLPESDRGCSRQSSCQRMGTKSGGVDSGRRCGQFLLSVTTTGLSIGDLEADVGLAPGFPGANEDSGRTWNQQSIGRPAVRAAGLYRLRGSA